ncbi:MAG: PIN domain-containing protein [Deltaproteobacteria bacterium]|nr:PIN domain-containing protein [Deltaproteobacteria bacterium]
MYLIDTSAWINFLRKRDDRLVPFLESRTAAHTDIVVFELLSGIPSADQSELNRFLALFASLPLTQAAALKAAAVASTMRRAGTRPQTTDMLIAGVALIHDATLIHRDSDFERIKRYCPLSTIEL